MLIVNNYNDNSNRITNNETLSYGNHAIENHETWKTYAYETYENIWKHETYEKHMHTNNDNFWKKQVDYHIQTIYSIDLMVSLIQVYS